MKKSERQKVYDKCGGRCAYCGCEITLQTMHVDHIEPVIRESMWVRGKGYRPTGKMRRGDNDRIDNLLPACAPCNLWKHAMSIDDFRKSVRTQIDKIKKTSCGFRLLLRYGIITINDAPDKFYFERLI